MNCVEALVVAIVVSEPSVAIVVVTGRSDSIVVREPSVEIVVLAEPVVLTAALPVAMSPVGGVKTYVS